MLHHDAVKKVEKKRRAEPKPPTEKKPKPPAKRPASDKSASNGEKRRRKSASEGRPPRPATPSKRESSEGPPKETEVKWTTLKHHGVLFPPEYEAHGVKLLYGELTVCFVLWQSLVTSTLSAVLFKK